METINKKQKHFKSLLNEYALMLKKQGRLNAYGIITSKNMFDLQLNKSTWYVVYKGENVFVDKVFIQEGINISFQVFLQNKFTPSERLSERLSSIYVVSEDYFTNNILYKNESIF